MKPVTTSYGRLFYTSLAHLVKAQKSTSESQKASANFFNQLFLFFKGKLIVGALNSTYFRQGMVWNGMEDDFSVFHTGNFLPFHFNSIPKIFHSIFHSILKFSSIFHSILPYQRNFRLEAMQRKYILLLCTFAMLLAAARKGAPTILRCNDR